MSPTISRISFAFLLVALGASAGHSQAWRESLESAAGSSKAAESARSPEQARALAETGAGRLTGEKNLSGLGLAAPSVKARAAELREGRDSFREPHERPERYYRDDRPQEPSQPWSHATKGILGGGLIGALLGGVIGLAFGPAGIAAGAVVGGLMGATIGYIMGKGADAVETFIDRW